MRLVEPIESESLAVMLVETFADDPFYRWYFRNETNPLHYFARKLRAGAERGDALVTPGGEAVLIVERLPARGNESAALAPKADPAETEHERQSRAFFARLAATHPAQAHVYLDIIGVSTAARGTGVGSRLMTGWLDQLDEAGRRLVFLHASTTRAQTFYERFGFVPGASLTLPDGLGNVIPMTRGA